MDKYYLAYEDRYKKIHSQGALWFQNNPTEELISWVNYFNIDRNDKICEVGCGEGRDSLYLSNLGYDVLGIDVSKTAIDKCREIAMQRKLDAKFEVVDGTELDSKIREKYKWMYSIGTLHMLVRDKDRHSFLKSIYDRLEIGGRLFLLNIGDGVSEKMTDVDADFEYEQTLQSGKTVNVKVIPYRTVNLDNHRKELENIGFKVDKIKITENQNYGKCITSYISK